MSSEQMRLGTDLPPIPSSDLFLKSEAIRYTYLVDLQFDVTDRIGEEFRRVIIG